jgi:hypothetical protein
MVVDIWPSAIQEKKIFLWHWMTKLLALVVKRKQPLALKDFHEGAKEGKTE